MNINTFFLDKLLAGDQSLVLGSKKSASPTNLFSDIIKVFEQEGEQNSQSSNNVAVSNLSSQNILQLPVNVIECNGAKLQALSQFIDAFMADPQLSVKATEVKHDLQSVVINKKQFLLSSDGLKNFIQGLIQNLGLNNSDDFKTIFSQNSVDENVAGIINNLNVKTDKTDSLTSQKETGSKVKSDDSVLNNGTMAQSLLQYLSENKSLSLSIKNGKDKLNINFYSLPEKNIETEFNLEKLSADFNKNSKEFNAASSNISQDQGNEKTVTAAPSIGLETNPADFISSPLTQNNINTAEEQPDKINPDLSANTVDLSQTAKPIDSVYKTEVIEITFNANVQSKNLESAGTQSKIYQNLIYGQTDLSKSSSIFNSSPVKKEYELFDAGFRLRNNFAAQLIPLQYSDNNKLVATPSAKTASSNPNPLLIQQSTPVVKVVNAGNNKTISADTLNSGQPTIKTSSGKEIVVNDYKILLNDLKGTLERAELTNKTSFEKESVIKEVKVLPNDFNESLQNIKLTNQTSSEKESVIKEIKVLLNDLNGKLESFELTKSSLPKDKIIFSTQTLEMKKEIEQIKIDLLSNEQDAKTNIAEASKSQKPAAVISKAAPVNEENPSTTIELPKAKEFAQEVKVDSLSGMVSQKITGNDEKVKVGKDTDTVKSVSDENIKSNKLEVKEANGKSSEEKEFAQNKSNDNFKNVLQNSDQTKSIDTDKFKIMTELKQTNEPMKVIKPTEIIPEFTKIIQAGEKQSMSFQLTPENLGKVKLIVDLVDNHINTRIEVENDQVKQFIQSNIEQLKQNLQSSGVHLSNVNVSLAESEQKSAKAFSQRRKMGEKISKIKEGEDTTRRSQKSLGYNTYEYLA